MCTKHLLGEHVELHMFVGCLVRKKTLNGFFSKGLLEVHSIRARHHALAREMLRRGMQPRALCNRFAPSRWARSIAARANWNSPAAARTARVLSTGRREREHLKASLKYRRTVPATLPRAAQTAASIPAQPDREPKSADLCRVRPSALRRRRNRRAPLLPSSPAIRSPSSRR